MPGLLLVFSEPGAAVSEAEFNDWYDNEHVPLRVPIPGFRSWQRWAAADGARPTFCALYDLDSPAVLAAPPYAALARTRSPRETALLARIALLDRRTYTLREPVYAPGPTAGTGARAYDARAPGPYASVVEVEVKPEGEAEFNRWYDEEHVPMLARTPGWVRSRRFELEFAGATGTEVKVEAGEGEGEGTCRPPKYLAIHEWESPAVFETAEFKAAVGTPWMAKLWAETVVESRRRLVKFVRSWDRE
ncbi:hypothetical protein BC628DRAFT_1330434 [Trametes gibbosa]|nr:hypothetical protein BC628DRAFT_1330434 [Trametes gibbosa]